MKKNVKSKVANTSGLKLLFFSAVLVSLYFNPRFADPFNSAKLYVLILTSFFLLAYFSIRDRVYVIGVKDLKNLKRILLFFHLVFLLLLTTNNNYYVFFIGESQRNLGYIAYFGYTIFMFLAAKYFEFTHYSILYTAILFLGVVYSAYGLMQANGLDFVEWNNPYNAIIGTLGNPNFAAAFMAILLTIIFGFTFLSGIGKLKKLINLLVVGLLAINIVSSDARQGILSAALGVSFFLFVLIINKNRILGLTSGFLLIAGGVYAILGMLQVGPLASMLYKDSVSLRGYYWRAGIEMFVTHPLSGVGIERYGNFFKMYREAAYPLKYGYELVSTNAHNVYIQFFATGGLGLGLSYFLLNLYILKRGIVGLRQLKSNDKVLFASIFSGWLAFQAQALVSIDNSGLTVWGWILGGLIVGLSSDNKGLEKLEKNINLRNQTIHKSSLSFIPGLVLIFSFVVVLLLSRSETNVYLARVAFNPENKNDISNVRSYAEAVIQDPLASLNYKLEVSNYLIQSGLENEGLQEFQKIVRKEPTNPLYLHALASMYEYKGRYIESINVRENILIYDPQNLNNMLQLARLYRDTENLDKSVQMRELINKFSPNSEQSEIVNKEIPF